MERDNEMAIRGRWSRDREVERDNEMVIRGRGEIESWREIMR